LIARQRANLKRTFVQAELPAVEDRMMPRLARTQRELLAATAEFTKGYEQLFGPVACLHEAQDAMGVAARALDAKNAKDGRTSEATALASLIKARQNLRKFLSQSSGQASECRRFDKEQSQKIRPPKKNEEQEKEKLAQLEQEIAELARMERKFSEEIASSNGGGAQMERLAQRQDAAAKKAQELQQLTNKDDALTELSRERMDAAAQSIQSSAQALHAGREQEAGERANDAAEQLERLARQVAALKPPDLANRLAGTQSLAQGLARQEQNLGEQVQRTEAKSGLGDRDRQSKMQQGLTEEGRTLLDLLNRNLADAAESDSELAQSLRDTAENSPPGAIIDQMRRAAEAMRAGRSEQAGREATDAAKKLDALAQQLDSTRRALTQPQLEKLMAAEKQAAETQKALHAVADGRGPAEAEKKMTDLRETLDALKLSDGKLAEAAQALAQATRQGGNHRASSDGPTPRLGFRPPVGYDAAVTRTIEALQSRIQELFLKEVLLDKDEAVPPQYKKYVDEYYRTLSEDLRK
jgi:hypothetical protein